MSTSRPATDHDINMDQTNPTEEGEAAALQQAILDSINNAPASQLKFEEDLRRAADASVQDHEGKEGSAAEASTSQLQQALQESMMGLEQYERPPAEDTLALREAVEESRAEYDREHLRAYEKERLPCQKPNGHPRQQQCPICLESITDPSTERVTALCGHTFCAVCLREWLKMRGACPVCGCECKGEFMRGTSGRDGRLQ